MAIQYKGKSPNKLWYGYQNTKAFFKAFGDYTTKKDAQSGAKNTGISLGTLLGAHMVVIPMVAAVPAMPLLLSFASSIVAFHFIFKAIRNFKEVGQSRFLAAEVSSAEDRWADNKARPSLLKRMFAKKPEQKQQQPDTRPRTTGPISKGVVFESEGKSFDFNENADKPTTPANNNKTPAAPKKKNGSGPKV